MRRPGASLVPLRFVGWSGGRTGVVLSQPGGTPCRLSAHQKQRAAQSGSEITRAVDRHRRRGAAHGRSAAGAGRRPGAGERRSPAPSPAPRACNGRAPRLDRRDPARATERLLVGEELLSLLQAQLISAAPPLDVLRLLWGQVLRRATASTTACPISPRCSHHILPDVLRTSFVRPPRFCPGHKVRHTLRCETFGRVEAVGA